MIWHDRDRNCRRSQPETFRLATLQRARLACQGVGAATQAGQTLRIAQGLPLAGVIFVRDTLAVAKVIEDLLAILGASEAREWENRIDFLPL